MDNVRGKIYYSSLIFNVKKLSEIHTNGMSESFNMKVRVGMKI